MRYPAFLYGSLTGILALAFAPMLRAAPPVSFDAPSTARAIPLDGPGGTPSDSDRRLYEITIPLSTLVKTRNPLPPYQVWVFCQAPRAKWRIVDFEPRTELTSPYVGPLQVDRQRETSHRLGVNLAGKLETWGDAKAVSELAGKEKETRRMAESPPMILLQASGTIDRGTGVYFKFRPSRQTTLEGTRDLRMVVEVPDDWRTSLLRLRCVAEPLDRKIDELFGEAMFGVAVYRAGDRDATRSAGRFADAEHRFLQAWKLERSPYGKEKPAALSARDWLATLLDTRPTREKFSSRQVAAVLEFEPRVERVEQWIGRLSDRLRPAARELASASEALRGSAR